MNHDTLRLLGIAKNKLMSGPKNLYCQIDTVCNLHCIFCHYHGPFPTDWKIKNRIQLPLPVLIKVFDDCRRLHVEHVCISAKGETTLHPDFEAIIDEATQRNFFVSVLTNGTFPERIIKTLTKAHLVKCNLSATCAEEFRLYHHAGPLPNFDMVTKNIARLGRLKTGQPKVSVTYVMHRFNYESLPAIFELAQRLDIDELNIKEVHGNQFHRLSLTPPMRAKTEKILTSLLKKNRLHRIKNNLLDHYLRTGEFFTPSGVRWKPAPCFMGWFQTFLMEQGDLMACCSRDNIVRIGNIYQKDIVSLWRSKRYQRIRQMAARGILQKKAVYLCPDCASHAENNLLISFVETLNNNTSSLAKKILDFKFVPENAAAA
ncbi:MAG: radical SAM protein [Candidatus Omnitrophica bacterium]|nr:radical SAM protein [Candidatus Omnitrophota bacterium]